MPTKAAKAKSATPKSKSKSKPAARNTPVGARDRAAEAKDALPDDLRRRDQPETPDSLAPTEQDEATLAPDGGSADHPIHDEPLEDMKPEDFEAAIDEAEKAKLEKHTEDETVDPRANREFSPGSSDPLDQKNRRPLRVPGS